MTDYQPNPRVNLFLDRLRKLPTGERAQFKRNAGAPLTDAGKTLGAFYRVLPSGVEPFQEESYYLIATLFPLVDEGGTGNLGQALRRAATSGGAQGLDRRFEILLDADATQFPFRLRQTLRLLKSKDVRVNWQILAEDMLNWNRPSRSVQKRWARSYFSEVPSSSSPSSQHSVEPAQPK